MATYNGSKYILDQLNSINDQTVLPTELIICDDCSSDDTVDIIKEFAENVNFTVNLIVNDYRLGYANNFMKALSLCKGDVIFFSDQDDFWFPNKISRVLNLFHAAQNVHLVINDAYISDSELIYSEVTLISQYKNASININSFVHGCCSAISKDFLSLILPFPIDLTAHDSWIVQIATLLDLKLIYQKPLQIYRQHGSNTSTYIVNSKDQLNYFDVLKKKLKKNISKDLEYELNNEKYLIQKIIYHFLDCKLISNKYFHQQLLIAEKVAKNKLLAINRRIININRPVLSRFFYSILTLFNFDYHDYFNGFQSFFRDVLLIRK